MSKIIQIREHYKACFQTAPKGLRWNRGPTSQLPNDFQILVFNPTGDRNMWTYATCGMSQQGDCVPIELHLFSPVETNAHVELLTVIAHYHLSGEYLDLGHTVNFGRPWLPQSKCDYGLISLPYLDGPDLEWLEQSTGRIRFLWLVPVTPTEVQFVKGHGLEALEDLFEEQKFNYLDPLRKSVV